MPILGLYPEGPANVINDWPIANPAAGAEIAVTVPAGELWVVKALAFRFVTGVAVANRTTQLHFHSVTGGHLWASEIGPVVTASQTENFLASVPMTGIAPIAPTPGVLWMPLPEIILVGGCTFHTTTANIAAADQYTVSGAGNFGSGCIIEKYLLS